MTITRSARLTLLGAISITAGCSQARSQAPDSISMKDVVARQIAMDRSAAGLPLGAGFGPDKISLEATDSSSGVRVFRGSSWALPHWHAYLVAIGPSGVRELGGFPAPEIVHAAKDLALSATSPRTATRSARQLAKLLDPNGASELVFPGDSADARLLTAWRKTSPAPWPPDSVVRTETGAIRVRVTVLSRAAQLPLVWQPLVYSFEFARSGELVAWASRTGNQFYTPNTP